MITRFKRGKALAHFSNLTRDQINTNIHMFTEDIHLAIMPIGGRTKKQPNFQIQFEGDEASCRKALDLYRSISTYQRQDAIELICDVIDRIASYLAWHGEAFYEIIFDKSQGKYFLEYFSNENLFRVPGYYIQLVPPKDYEHFKKRAIFLPSGGIWKISIPSVLSGSSGYKKMLSKLKRFDNLGPKFYYSDLENNIQSKHFNFQESVLNTKIYFRRATRAWGWNGRDYSLTNCTEFFVFYKIITFKWAQAILREHIINEMNNLLSRLQIKATIKVLGLPLSKEILQIREMLSEGKISFEQANTRTSLL